MTIHLFGTFFDFFLTKLIVGLSLKLDVKQWGDCSKFKFIQIVRIWYSSQFWKQSFTFFSWSDGLIEVKLSWEHQGDLEDLHCKFTTQCWMSVLLLGKLIEVSDLWSIGPLVLFFVYVPKQLFSDNNYIQCIGIVILHWFTIFSRLFIGRFVLILLPVYILLYLYYYIFEKERV